MTLTSQFLRYATVCIALSGVPGALMAQPVELSQSQLRHLVAQEEILAAEVIAATAENAFGGTVVDIRGFTTETCMTYRVLMQHRNGAVVEVLLSGQDGEQLSTDTDRGAAISTAARKSLSNSAVSKTTTASGDS